MMMTRLYSYPRYAIRYYAGTVLIMTMAVFNLCKGSMPFDVISTVGERHREPSVYMYAYVHDLLQNSHSPTCTGRRRISKT